MPILSPAAANRPALNPQQRNLAITLYLVLAVFLNRAQGQAPGTLLASYSLGGDPGTAELVQASDGSICAGTDAGSLVIIRPDGTKATRFLGTTSPVVGLAVAPDGTIICAQEDRWVQAVNPDTLNIKWSYRTGANQLSNAGALSLDGTLFLAGADLKLHALDSRSGQLLWQVDLPLRGPTAPVVDDSGLVFVAFYSTQRTFSPWLACVDSHSRKLKWTAYNTSGFRGRPSLGEIDGIKVVWVADPEGYMLAYEQSSGRVVKVILRLPSGPETGWITSTVIGSDGLLFAGGQGGGYGITGFDTNGVERIRVPTEVSSASASPAVDANGNLITFFRATNPTRNLVISVHPYTGFVNWAYLRPSSAAPSSILITANGVVWFATRDFPTRDNLFAIKSDAGLSRTSRWPVQGGGLSGSGRPTPPIGGRLAMGRPLNGLAAVNLDGEPATSYVLQQTTDLREWMPLQVLRSENGSAGILTETGNSQRQRAFYRATH